MSKKSRFSRLFYKQHGKRAQARPKSATLHFYHIHWSLSTQLTLKTSLLFTYQMVGLLVNTLAPDKKYPVLNRDNFTIPIQMQLCRKNFFLYFLLSFWNADWTFKILKKNMTLTYFELPELRTPETWSDKCLKSHVLEDPSTSIMVNVPNHFGNLHYSIFTLLIEHF